MPDARTSMTCWVVPLQGTLYGVNASFTATNPLGDPSLSSITSLTLYELIHTVYLTGATSAPALSQRLCGPHLCRHGAIPHVRCGAAPRQCREEEACLPAYPNLQWLISVTPSTKATSTSEIRVPSSRQTCQRQVCMHPESVRMATGRFSLFRAGAYNDGLPDFLVLNLLPPINTVHSSSDNVTLPVRDHVASERGPSWCLP